MPFLAHPSGSSRNRTSKTSRREKDGFVLRGAEIIRQQIKRQEEHDLAYYAKLDPELKAESPLNDTGSISSDEDDFMDYSLSSKSYISAKPKQPQDMRFLPKTMTRSGPPGPKDLRAPSHIYRSQSSDISFPDSTDDSSLFTDNSGCDLLPPPPPRNDLDSSFSFLDDSEWAEMQTNSMEDLGVCSPAWSMPAKHVSDDEVEDEEDDYDDAYGSRKDDYDDQVDVDLLAMDTDNDIFDDDGWKIDEIMASHSGERSQSPVKKTLSKERETIVPEQSRAHSLVKKARSKEHYNIQSPLGSEYSRLWKDPGYRHAINAGQCWQSIVGQLVRFPSTWFNGARGPPLGVPSSKGAQPLWQFYGRFRVRNNRNLKKLVPSRASPGALVLHLIVQDLMTFGPVADVVVGVFHPNARGVRRTLEPNPQDELNRDIWMAVRKREECVSVVDHVLAFGKIDGAKSPLGIHHITNHNMRAVFGDHPPTDTMFLAEDILYARLSRALESSPELSPAEALLEMFVFDD